MPAERIVQSPVWSRREIADRLGCSPHVIGKWVTERGFPPPVTVNKYGAMFYDAEAVRRWWDGYNIDTHPRRWSLTRAAAELELDFGAMKLLWHRRQLPDPDGYVNDRPWWEPDRLRSWHNQRRTPDGAWHRRQIADQLGKLSPPPMSELPKPDGTSSRGAWWWPDTIRPWLEQRSRRQLSPSVERRHQRLRRAVQTDPSVAAEQLRQLGYTVLRPSRKSASKPARSASTKKTETS